VFYTIESCCGRGIHRCWHVAMGASIDYEGQLHTVTARGASSSPLFGRTTNKRESESTPTWHPERKRRFSIQTTLNRKAPKLPESYHINWAFPARLILRLRSNNHASEKYPTQSKDRREHHEGGIIFIATGVDKRRGEGGGEGGMKLTRFS
jgi:hypothetical protein